MKSQWVQIFLEKAPKIQPDIPEAGFYSVKGLHQKIRSLWTPKQHSISRKAAL